MDDTITRIKGYLLILNPSIVDNELLNFVINEVINRVQLYLNTEKIPIRIERILADVINTGMKKVLNEQNNSDADHAINSISDNGQSISYANEITRYFSTVSDEELFTGFTSLLSRYRRIKVVYTKNNETENV